MKKKKTTLGRHAKPVELTIQYRPGAIVIQSLEEAVESLEEMEQAQRQIQPALEFIEQVRRSATDFAKTTGTTIIQMDDHYWRKQQRTSRLLVATDDDIPADAPKGTKSVKSVVDKIKGTKKPVWMLVTRRVLDPGKLDKAVKLGIVKEKQLQGCYLESPGAVFIQKYDGIPPEDRDEDG